MARAGMGGNSLDLDQILEPDGMAKEISSLYHRWDADKQVVKKRWAETIEYVYATSTLETTNAQNPWSHSTHVPKITQIHDNLMANYMSALFPHREWMKFYGGDEASASRKKRKAVTAYLSTKHDQSNFIDDINFLLQDWILYGNSFVLVSYCHETHMPDGEEGELVDGYVGPKLYRISPNDIVFNPLATDFASSPKIIRTIKSMGQLIREIEEMPDMAYAEGIVDKIKNFRTLPETYSSADIEKNNQLQFDGYGSINDYLSSGNVEILDFYGDYYDRNEDKFYKNHVVTVVDRTWVARAQPLNTYSGRPNIFHCPWRTRPDNLWGMGPLDNLVGMQYLINHLENSRADAFDQMLVPTRVLVGDVEEHDVVPGKPAGKYIIPTGDGSVQNLAPDTVALSADNTIQLLEARMEAYAGSPRESMGIRTPGEKTALEVQTLQNAASRIFQSKINFYETQFISKIINAEIEEARRNLNTSDVARTTDNDLGVVEFMTITKEDLTAKGTLIPTGARHFARQNQLAQNLQALTQAMAQDQMLQQHFPSTKLARAYEDLLGMESLSLVEDYGRVGETAEIQRRGNAAQQQVAQEDQTILQEDDGVEELS